MSKQKIAFNPTASVKALSFLGYSNDAEATAARAAYKTASKLKAKYRQEATFSLIFFLLQRAELWETAEDSGLKLEALSKEWEQINGLSASAVQLTPLPPLKNKAFPLEAFEALGLKLLSESASINAAIAFTKKYELSFSGEALTLSFTATSFERWELSSSLVWGDAPSPETFAAVAAVIPQLKARALQEYKLCLEALKATATVLRLEPLFQAGDQAALQEATLALKELARLRSELQPTLAWSRTKSFVSINLKAGELGSPTQLNQTLDGCLIDALKAKLESESVPTFSFFGSK